MRRIDRTQEYTLHARGRPSEFCVVLVLSWLVDSTKKTQRSEGTFEHQSGIYQDRTFQTVA